MIFIVLLRGVNVGGNRKVQMKVLKEMIESLGYSNVSTYLNSGNLIFESQEERQDVQKTVETALAKAYEFDIPILVKTAAEMKKIAEAIPEDWQNDESSKADVAYLFPEIDTVKILDELPVKREYIDIRYVKGALYWRIDRKNYNKSQLNKLVGHRYYQLMTIRNVNTARRLAEI